MKVIGYAFEADLHCEACTRDRFPDPDNATDREGNPVSPLLDVSERFTPGDWVCGDCLQHF